MNEDKDNWLIKLIKDNPDGRVFPFRIHGDVYAANKKTKKPCRIPIIIPDDLDDTTNLKFLDNWKFLVFAFPNKKEG